MSDSPLDARERILITGPGGRVGPHITPLLRRDFSLRLLDTKPIATEGDDEFILADIRDLAAVQRACEGVRAVVHLAAVSDEDDFHTRLLPVNVAGTYNVFEAARQAGVRKVVFTSTAQTVLNYPRGEFITPEMAVRPATVYACTKIFGEALARYYSDIHGLSMICIRLSWFHPPESALLRERIDMRAKWCSPRDLAQLITKSIRADVPLAIFFGLSNNSGRFLDYSNAQLLVGYAPVDDSAKLFANAPGETC